MENKKRFLSFKQMTRKDWGRSAITGLLAPVLAVGSDLVWLEALVSVVAFLGLICGIVWFCLTFKEKSLYEKITTKAVMIFLLIILVISAFYWFSIRPAFAKKNCNGKATEVILKTGGDYSDYNAIFNICMRDKGL